MVPYWIKDCFATLNSIYWHLVSSLRLLSYIYICAYDTVFFSEAWVDLILDIDNACCVCLYEHAPTKKTLCNQTNERYDAYYRVNIQHSSQYTLLGNESNALGDIMSNLLRFPFFNSK